MSRSDDAGHYFQTSDSLATGERRSAKAKNKHGKPIKLQSKILAVLSGRAQDGGIVYVAEAAGDVKRVDLEAGSSRSCRKAPLTAPVTSLALAADAIYGGCWDKSIYGAPLGDASSKQPAQWRPKLSGHTDFVKCLLSADLDGQPVLVSGGADAAIIVWDLTTGKPIHKLKGPAKAIQDLIVDPLGLPEELDEAPGGFVLFSASSDREIRRWYVGRCKAYELPDSVETPILAHETSVYKLRFDDDGDLWTASADKTARHLVRSRGWEADIVLPHPDFVRDVVVTGERAGLVVTACRDEEVRVWDASSGDLVCTYSGHYEEETGLALVAESGVVSVSIDGTVRRWSLERREIARYLEEVEREKDGLGKEGGAEGEGGRLTAEEEAELAELMDDED
ncbi:hypothetical protein LTR53_007769 [Teratosphaeriaceae sp. CCFEE 6253]|nr:hypothetical protein LTR53_007769 [Teratosphaeriaceae sp. CCFEE 6253]